MKPVSDSANAARDELAQPLGSRPLTDADYRLMVEAVTDYAIFALDLDGFIRSWNAGARKLKGYDADEVIGRHFSMFYPQEMKDRQWPQHELAEALKVGRFEDEGWRIRKDGTRFWANIIITRLLGPGGELRGFSKITRDLSERRRQEELLRNSEERFRLLVESVKDYAIFMLDPSGHVVSWNPGAENNKGYKAAEIIGKHFSVFYPEELAHTGAPELELETALKKGRYRDEGWRVRKDGSRYWAGVVLTAIYDELGRHRGFAKVTRDLTESRKISALEDEGRRILQFIAMLGHELRNPLAPMTNAVALMRREPLEPRIAGARDVIDRQLKQITRLVDDLLDVGRVTSGKIHLETKPVALSAVIAQAVEAVGKLVDDRRHQLTIDLGNSETWVAGDHVRLVQIVTNLLNNAAKFTQKNGRIGVTLRTVGDHVEIRVKDNGPGIAEELRDDIFKPFFQGKQHVSRSDGGLGLGLALTQQLATLHGGDVAAYSKGQAGEGSEFVVRLPVIAAPAEARPRSAHAAKRILVVDDNHDSADTMCLLLQSLGYEAQSIYEGNAALGKVLSEAPDAVLLDIGLPGLSGLEVAERIRAEQIDPPKLIAISGYGHINDREAAFKAGFFAHLSKPVDFDELAELLRRIFA